MASRFVATALTLTGVLAFPTPSKASDELKVVPIDDPPPINTPVPLLLPMIPNCEQFHLVTPGETCYSLAQSVGMTVDELKTLNPFFGKGGKECARGLLAGYWCCVKALPAPDERFKGADKEPAPKEQEDVFSVPFEEPAKIIGAINDKVASKRPNPTAPKPTRPRPTVTVTVQPKPAEPTRTAIFNPAPNAENECEMLGRNCPNGGFT